MASLHSAKQENQAVIGEKPEVWQEYLAKAKALHLRPVRYTKAKSLRLQSGVEEVALPNMVYIGRFADDIVALYRVQVPRPRSLWHGHPLRPPVAYLGFQTIDSVLPFTDEELATEVCFATDIARMLEWLRTDIARLTPSSMPWHRR